MNDRRFFVLVNSRWWVWNFSSVEIDVSHHIEKRLPLTQGEAEILRHLLENDPAMFTEIVEMEALAT